MSGPEFDAAWISAQITSHQQTLAAGQTELQVGSSEPAKSVATSSAPVVQKHLDMLTEMSSSRGRERG